MALSVFKSAQKTSLTERDASFTSKLEIESGRGIIKATTENPASALTAENNSGWIEIGFWDDDDSEPDPLESNPKLTLEIVIKKEVIESVSPETKDLQMDR